MNLVRYRFQEWPTCAKCGAGAQRGGPGNLGWDPVTRSVHFVCWSCRYEYTMAPADEQVVYIQKTPHSQTAPWWRFW